MSTPQETLQALPAKPVSAILEQLHYMRQKVGAGELPQMPLTIFHLRSGRDLSGWILQHSSKSDSVVIQLQDRQSPANVSYFSPRDVEAITVVEVLTVAQELTF